MAWAMKVVAIHLDVQETNEKDMYKMQETESRNRLSAYQSPWSNAASILVRSLHEGILQGISLGEGQAMILGSCRERLAEMNQPTSKDGGFT